MEHPPWGKIIDMRRKLQALLDDPTFSTYRESLLESIFVSELVQEAWVSGLAPVELSHAFVDFQGYDLVATCGSVTRHIQLKALRTPRIALHRALEDKPSAYCVLMKPEIDENRVLIKYRYYGSSPTEKLRFPASAPSAKRSRPAVVEGEVMKLDRENHVIVRRSDFIPEKPAPMKDLLPLLFGRAEPS